MARYYVSDLIVHHQVGRSGRISPAGQLPRRSRLKAPTGLTTRPRGSRSSAGVLRSGRPRMHVAHERTRRGCAGGDRRAISGARQDRAIRRRAAAIRWGCPSASCSWRPATAPSGRCTATSVIAARFPPSSVSAPLRASVLLRNSSDSSGVVLGDAGPDAFPVLPGGTEDIVLGVDDYDRGIASIELHERANPVTTVCYWCRPWSIP